MFWTALLLGVVEGLTEFLPVSSTGHLILTTELIGFEDRRAEVFTVFIQLGAILSVAWEYRAKLFRVAAEFPASHSARSFVLKMGLAFVPSVVLGLLLHEFVVRHLFNSVTVAAALITGGVLILIVEAQPRRTVTHDVDSMSWGQALVVGLAQCVALLWPGFSRSAATILGGLTAGLDRRTATEFSFLLALPTMFAAGGYSLFKSYHWLRPEDLLWLGMAFGVSFVVAWGSVRWLLRFVSNHSFRIFAWYRIAVGAVILLLLNGLVR
jgi:undecaprenyl-diphosphatase